MLYCSYFQKCFTYIGHGDVIEYRRQNALLGDKFRWSDSFSKSNTEQDRAAVESKLFFPIKFPLTLT